MDYKLFDDFITLQALFKELGIIQSGGAIKGFLAETTVLFNGQDEKRRGKKLRLGDKIELPEQELVINLIAPSQEEIEQHEADQAEKARVAALVKKLNQENKQNKKAQAKKGKVQARTDKKRPVRFPGT